MKASFTDGDGREWKLRLTVGLVEDIQKETGVELGDESNADWLALLFGKRRKLVEVLWLLCEAQADKAGVTPEQFGHLFDGATLDAAGTALAAAVADFFPRSRISQALRENLQAILEAGEEKAVAEIRATAGRSSASATTSPGSSALTPAG